MKYKVIFIISGMLLLSACDNKASEAKSSPQSQKRQDELQIFLKQIKSNLVFAQGGKFWMGDFCKKMRNDGAYCTGDKDNKPLHEIELASYSISKFKTTNQEYNFYLNYNNRKKSISSNKLMQHDLDIIDKDENTPVHVNWNDAQNYCQWLSYVSGLTFSLPTEAQWEYAARSRGEFRIVATDDNTLRVSATGKGENIATDYDRDEAGDAKGIEHLLVTFPGDKYPPNPLGVYDMAGNGFEWTGDWYDPDYYSKSPAKNPMGPAKPVTKGKYGFTKVARGKNYSNAGVGGITIERFQRVYNDDYPLNTTVRCVVNSLSPVSN